MNNILTKRCPYCRGEMSIVGMSARDIPGYKNPLTGLSTAMVEKLSCGHEFVDGKFNVDSLYHSNPIPPQEVQDNLMQSVAIHHHHNYKKSKRKGRLTGLDIAVMACSVVLTIMFPPLIVLPILYFLFRMNAE